MGITQCICSAGALPHQWCLSGWNGSLRVMSRSGLLWGLVHRFRSRSDVGEPGHAFGAVGIRLLKKADVFKLLEKTVYFVKCIKCIVDIDIRRYIGLGNSKPLAGWIVVIIMYYKTQYVFLSAPSLLHIYPLLMLRTPLLMLRSRALMYNWNAVRIQ